MTEPLDVPREVREQAQLLSARQSRKSPRAGGCRPAVSPSPRGLSRAAQAIWGADSAIGREWAAERHAELDAGKLDALIGAFTAHASTNEEARKCADYLETHRDRMRYPHFQAAGLCTSTGLLEAGCRVAVGQRLKRSGMHCTARGANRILALRCARLSGRFEGFWQRRVPRQAAA